MLVDRSPTEVEASVGNLTSSLSAMAGLSVRKSNILPAGQQTELRIYGVKGTGTVLDGNDLLARLTSLPLVKLGVRDVQLTRGEEEEALGSVEVAVLTMACLVFLGAFIAVLCICCIKMKRFVNEKFHLRKRIWRLLFWVGWVGRGLVVVIQLFSRMPSLHEKI